MSFDWLLHSIASKVILSSLGLAGVWLKARKEKLAGPLLYGLVTVTCCAMLYFSLTGKAIFGPAPTDESNIEEHVKEWYAAVGVSSIPTIDPVKSAAFAYLVTMNNGGTKVTVWRDTKYVPDYLRISSGVDIGANVQASLHGKTVVEARHLVGQLLLELARTGVDFNEHTTPDGVLDRIDLADDLPISNLTSSEYMAALNRIDKACKVGETVINLSLDQGSANSLPPPRN